MTSSPTIVIEAEPDSVLARLRAAWRYRGFYGFLFREITWRKARNSVLGVWFLVLRPLIPAVSLIVVFSRIAPADAGATVPYPVFFLSGYIPWRLFQSAMMFLPRTLRWAQGIMQKTYFPRLLVPLAGFGNTLIEFAILLVAFVVVVAVSTWKTGALPLHLGWQTLWLIPSFVAALVFALAFGMIIGVVALFFRDVIFSTRFVVQVAMFLTPVVAPVTIFPEAYRWLLYTLNPMAQVVIVSRWALTGQGEFHLGFVLLSYATILATLAAALTFFCRAEAFLGDQM